MQWEDYGEKVRADRRKILTGNRHTETVSLLNQVASAGIAQQYRWLDNYTNAVMDLIWHALQSDRTCEHAARALISLRDYILSRSDKREWVLYYVESIEQTRQAAEDQSLVQQLATHLFELKRIETLPEHVRRLAELPFLRPSPRTDDLIRMYISVFEMLKATPKMPLPTLWIDEAKRLLVQTSQLPLLARMHEVLAFVYAYRSNLTLAIYHGERSYRLYEKLHDHYGMFQSASVLGYTFSTFDMVKCGRGWQDRARRHAEQLEGKSLPRLAYQEAYVLFQADLFAESLYWYQTALREYELQPHMAAADKKRAQAACLQGMALAQIWLGDYTMAQVEIEQAYDLWKQVDQPSEIANNRYTLGFLYAHRRDKVRAKTLLLEALQLCKAILVDELRQDMQQLIQDTLRRIQLGDIGTGLHARR